MKNTIIVILCLLFHLSLMAQNRMTVNENKAIHLISTEKISYLQVGNPALILAEIVPEHPNLVRLKAAGEFEGESSVTIVASGKLYAIPLVYGEVKEITFSLESFSSVKANLFSGDLMPEYVLEELSRKILSKRKKNVRNRRTEKDGIIMQVSNIYLKNDVLFFELQLSNKTNMGYEIEDFHWWINDKKQYKATNVQEYPIHPKYQFHHVKYIPANTSIREVFVFPKLSIPDKRVLRIEMLEKALGNTGRKLNLNIKNKDILKARKL